VKRRPKKKNSNPLSRFLDLEAAEEDSLGNEVNDDDD
jgi:hypothetical protein